MGHRYLIGEESIDSEVKGCLKQNWTEGNGRIHETSSYSSGYRIPRNWRMENQKQMANAERNGLSTLRDH